MHALAEHLPLLLEGAKLTIVLAVTAYVLGLLFGTMMAVGRFSASRSIRVACTLYVDFFRGTPLIVQLFMVYFGVPSILQQLGLPVRIDRFYAAVITLGAYIAAYISEDLRTGVRSLGVGQWDAARALGLRPSLVWCLVILPQGFRRALPSLGNEAVGMLKDTSLVSVIGYGELFRKGQFIVAETYQPFEVYALVSIIYLLLTFLTSHLNRSVEKRLAT